MQVAAAGEALHHQLLAPAARLGLHQVQELAAAALPGPPGNQILLTGQFQLPMFLLLLILQALPLGAGPLLLRREEDAVEYGPGFVLLLGLVGRLPFLQGQKPRGIALTLGFEFDLGRFRRWRQLKVFAADGNGMGKFLRMCFGSIYNEMIRVFLWYRWWVWWSIVPRFGLERGWEQMMWWRWCWPVMGLLKRLMGVRGMLMMLGVMRVMMQLLMMMVLVMVVVLMGVRRLLSEIPGEVAQDRVEIRGHSGRNSRRN